MLTILTNTLRTKAFQRCAATNAAIRTKTRPKKKETRPAIIQCKRPTFNLYDYQEAHCKFRTIPLASSGWLHSKSSGDWFHLNATATEKENTNKMRDMQQFLQENGLQFDNDLIVNLRNEFEVNSLTSIQCQGWPKILGNHHTLIAAQTGCGKTLCYLMPVVQRILERKRSMANERKMNSPLAIILTPGRELASQIGDVVRKLCWEMDIRVKTILGGNTKQMMLNPEFDDVDIVVASMGSLSKLVTTGIYRMNHVRHVILDEADTLLDDSFSDKLVHLMKRFPVNINIYFMNTQNAHQTIRKIGYEPVFAKDIYRYKGFIQLPRRFHKNCVQSDTDVGTQLILASATMPTNINELLQKVIDIQTIHEVTSPDLHRLMPHVDQKFMRVNKGDRQGHLLGILKKELALRRPVIIFSNKTPTCDYVSIFLNNSGINCLNLNGDMLMKIRLGRFEQFQNAQCDVLSTTDMSSRGLDTTRARHVINFDFPLHVSDYIHRCGRIGRVGNVERCSVSNLISSRREIDVVQRIEHAARCGGILPDVNANIKNIINTKIMQDMKRAGIPLPISKEQQQEEEF